MTLRELVEKAVGKIKSDLTQEQIRDFAEYIMNLSTLEITKNYLDMQIASLHGVGEDNKDKEIENLSTYLVFWYAENIDTSNRQPHLAELPSETWRLWSFSSFTLLEHFLASHTYPGCLNGEQGDLVVFVNSEVVEYKLEKSDVEVDDGFVDLSYNYASWSKDFYELRVWVDGERVVEFYNNRKQLELRILRLIEDGITSIKVVNVIDKKALDFEVTKTVVCTSDRTKDNNLRLLWVSSLTDTLKDEESWGSNF